MMLYCLLYTDYALQVSPPPPSLVRVHTHKYIVISVDAHGRKHLHITHTQIMVQQYAKDILVAKKYF